MIGAVLDTNVFGFRSPHQQRSSDDAQINSQVCFDRVFPLLSIPVSPCRVRSVLRRPHLNIPVTEAVEVLRSLRAISTLVTPERRVHVASDPSDNKFLECALEARADDLVTGNLRHFPARFQDVGLSHRGSS